METKAFALPWKCLTSSSDRCVYRAKTSLGVITFTAILRDTWFSGWELVRVASPFHPELVVDQCGITVEDIAANVSAAYSARVAAEYEALQQATQTQE